LLAAQAWTQPWIGVVLVLLSAATVLAPVSFHHRGHTTLFSLSEVPLLLGLVFVSPAVLVLSRLVGEALVFGVVRRQSPLKLTFNTATAAASAAVAATIYRPLLGHHQAFGPAGWAAGAAALAAAAIVSQASVTIVIRLHGQRPPPSSGFDFLRFSLVLGASIGLAFVVLDAAWWDTWAVLPLAIVGALIVFAYRAYLKLTQRFGALEQLYDFSRALGGPNLDPAGTAWAILEHVQSVMRARRAELLLMDVWPEAHSLALDGDARSKVRRITISESSCVAEVISGSRPSLRQQVGDRTSAAGCDPVLGQFRDALVVPLLSGDQPIGALVALDRQEELDSFDDDDLRLFEALAAHASTTLERARLVEELRFEAESKTYQATHDLLTDLPNRALFLERATAALAETGRAAVAILDLDRFKEVNDTLGHSTGDKLVCEVAECLVRAAHGRATVARLGGDEFALIVPDIIGPEEAIGIVRDLEEALSKPMNIDGITLAVRASAGIALSPEHGDSVSLLLQRADIAMYLAKERRSGIEMYSAVQEQNMERKLVLGGQLAQALAQGRHELYLMYQPIADLDTGELLRFEALARWNHPELGQVPAEEFIGIAEQMGLIGEITEFVLSSACAEAARWRDAGMPIGLAVNLSGRDLSDQSLVDKVEERLAAYNLPASSLTLEVTETEVMADIVEASTVLGELGRLGVRIAVDDFGTGYSSLAYLHRLPINELKIDRSFVGNVAYDDSNAIIVRSSIAMAHSLGLSVVAEGAEDELTCAVLADAGCDSLQGYYFSRPLSTPVLHQWLRLNPRLEYSRELAPTLRVIPGEAAEQAASPRYMHEEIEQIIS
jgi:diguanylate cyclase (GGDEF)-like protein